MYLERKLATISMVVLAVTAAFAVAQVGPARQGSGDGQVSGAAAAPVGAFDSLKMSPMQAVLGDIIIWEQSNALHELGGNNPDYNSLSSRMKDARMEVIRACNLYQRATMNAAQQAQFDRTILDPSGHPLPAKWEKMRLKGTLVSELLKADDPQQKKASSVLKTFRDRNLAIWGKGNDGGYVKNHNLLISDFRGILNPTQLKEFNSLWTSYKQEVDVAKASAVIKP